MRKGIVSSISSVSVRMRQSMGVGNGFNKYDRDSYMSEIVRRRMPQDMGCMGSVVLAVGGWGAGR